jgi:hypothetical protein
LTWSHFSASTCWESFTYPRLLVGLDSVRGRKFILSPNIKGCVLGIYYTLVILLFFAPVLKRFWLKLYSLDILVSFWCSLLPLRWLWDRIYVVKLPEIFDFQGPNFQIRNYLSLSAGKVWSVMLELSQCKIMIAESSAGSGLYLLSGAVFL